MKLSHLLTLCLVLLSASASALNHCNPPSCETYNGFFLGAGGSYNNIEYDFGLNDERTMRGCGLKFAPVLQAGYFLKFCRCPNVLFGIKAFYKYVDFEQAPSTLVSAQQAVELQHEYGIIGMVAQHYCHGIYYAGIGAAWSNPGYSYQLTNPAIYKTECETQTGLTWQIGMTYDLCQGWFLDVNYTYVHNSKINLDITNGITGNACFKTQEFMLTINKAFNCS